LTTVFSENLTALAGGGLCSASVGLDANPIQRSLPCPMSVGIDCYLTDRGNGVVTMMSPKILKSGRIAKPPCPMICSKELGVDLEERYSRTKPRSTLHILQATRRGIQSIRHKFALA